MYISNISSEDLQKLETISFSEEVVVVDNIGYDFDRAIKYLNRQKIIGFDTESRPCFSSSQPSYGISLLQFSGARKAFLFRIKKTGLHKRLCDILENKNIIKVGAAVKDDIMGLQKYSSFTPASFVDLQKMAGEYGIKDKSVKKMSAIILGRRVSKAQQLSNWEAEILSDMQIKYAATDAWVCREMYLELCRSEKTSHD